MNGIDISNHQKGIDLAKRNFDFAIVKATEGKTFVDPSFRSHIEQLKQLNKLIGVYHYARPDNQRVISEMMKEADHFTNTIEKEGLLTKAVLFLDWEQNPINRTDLMEAWIHRVFSNTGIYPIIYSSHSFLKDIDICAKWCAMWPNIAKFSDFASEEWIDNNIPIDIPLMRVWQYTSRGVWPGFSGRVDFDYSPYSHGDWKAWAGDGIVEEELSLDMQWAIDIGLFVGYNDGSYRPKENVTRSQLATILRRYDKYLMEGG